MPDEITASAGTICSLSLRERAGVRGKHKHGATGESLLLRFRTKVSAWVNRRRITLARYTPYDPATAGFASKLAPTEKRFHIRRKILTNERT